MNKKKKRGLTIMIIAVVMIVALFLALINFLTDLLWFIEMGYLSVFLTKLFTMLKIGIPAFIIISLLSFAYLKALKGGYYKKIESQDNDAAISKRLNLMALGLSAAFGALFAFFVASRVWFEMLQFINSTDVNIQDPLYNLDISFYLFKLGFIKQLNTIAIGLIIAFAVLTVAYYMLMMSQRRPLIFEDEPQDESDEYEDDEDDEGASGNSRGGQQNRGGNFGAFGNFGDILNKLTQALGGGGGGYQNYGGPSKPKKKLDDDNYKNLVKIASKQIIVLGVLFFLMVGVNFLLKQFDLLYSERGCLYGAGFTDINVTLWMYRVLIGLSVVAAVGFVIGFVRKKFRSMLTVPVIMILIGVIGTGGAYIVQNFIVSPDEINKENQYLARSIKYTQYAYNLGNVSMRTFTAANNLTQEDIASNMETISNIRINDYTPAKKFYNNVQTIRPYYTFTDVDVDRYMINGEYTQTFLSAREIDDTSAQTSIPQTWLNNHIKYTHGYGITLSRVDKITASGQPDMLIKNIPPASDVSEINITRPEIYFGEMTHDYVLVKTNEPEFDYPTADSSAETIYDGTAGIRLNLINKTLFSIRERSLKLLVSSNLTNESRILINRNIMQRVQTIMPMLTYDTDPYIVTVDGRLFWIVDAYTLSRSYPYSEPYSTNGVNYIRNSIKIVIDAYNGTTNYYIVDPTDPIAETYKKIYPALFKEFDQMPDSLKAHIRYPNLMLSIQANVYKRYHMNDVVMFYQNEDVWDIAKEIYERSEVPMVPNYYIMKIPGENRAEFVNSIPFTPRDKKNMSGLLIARNDLPNYGEMVLYQLPKGKIVYGPMQIEAQIDQHPEISKEFSLWNSSGSTYNRGNMFVVPINDSLLYVEPVYLEAENSSIPEVKRVIVAYGDKIAYRATLGEALEELFGSTHSTQIEVTPGESSDETVTPDSGPHSLDELIQLASDAFDNAQNAQKNGDWAAYGEYLNQLQAYLEQMQSND